MSDDLRLFSDCIIPRVCSSVVVHTYTSFLFWPFCKHPPPSYFGALAPAPAFFSHLFSSSLQMSSPVDLSVDTSHLADEFQLQSDDIFLDNLSSSPVKKQGSVYEAAEALSTLATPNLRCDFAPANELFQVTTHLRRERDISSSDNLHHNKIEKLLRQLENTNESFELDDQLRTRVFKGRFTRKDTLDALELHLDSYLQGKENSPENINATPSSANENKENHIEPSKRKLRQPLHDTKRLRGSTSVPVLQALPNVLNGAQRESQLSSQRPTQRSPQRICVPRRRAAPPKPALRPSNDLNIFLVNSSTGMVNDATQFGTELNASNCEGFPMPEDVNEVVQIPTNETVPASAKQKMAIIKAFHSKRFPIAGDGGTRGFYTKQESDEYKQKGKTSGAPRDGKRHVRWAEDLEW
ncbi:hypothetical protein CLUG_01182 [Clavispora lusitaniae ATCC 42720]|uniref:Uncharacterized protein n=2 Tax=Clavispora lusitaniae TaxID=36911 RepID=C4XZ09_CLAL4|nr:uncharacterized protein CLUG_01182 [Clavispora lusitaniae ATCC 42720]EEQ37059.1 hypothetical protein CLUG_01182 [Clavispora lusitaniae ATCC 42720]